MMREVLDNMLFGLSSIIEFFFVMFLYKGVIKLGFSTNNRSNFVKVFDVFLLKLNRLSR